MNPSSNLTDEEFTQHMCCPPLTTHPVTTLARAQQMLLALRAEVQEYEIVERFMDGVAMEEQATNLRLALKGLEDLGPDIDTTDIREAILRAMPGP